MNENEINDIRNINEFKTITFSNYSRSKVKIELIKSFQEYNIEPACYWSIELICAGHFNDLWYIIIYYITRYIHITNPKLILYLCKRFEYFKNIVNNGYNNNNEIQLRNNNNIRKLFAEIICIICYSKKGHAFENYSIKTNNDFDITNITHRLTAPDIKFADKVFKNSDCKEIFIAINEFIYNISDANKDNISACYWLEWILKFDIITKQKKINLNCARRTFAIVEDKYQMNYIWIIWEGLLIQSENNKNINKIINSLLTLFCMKYKPTCNRQRKYILYAAISFVTEDINFNNSLINNNLNSSIKNITNNINILYKQVKSNEKSPNTDYLYNGLPENNIEKSIKKLETMNLILDNSFD